MPFNLCNSWEGKKGQESTFGTYAGLESWVSLLRQKATTQRDTVECGSPDYEFSGRMLFIVYIFLQARSSL